MFKIDLYLIFRIIQKSVGLQSKFIEWFLYDSIFNSIIMWIRKGIIMCALLQCMIAMTLRESFNYIVTIENTNHK